MVAPTIVQEMQYLKFDFIESMAMHSDKQGSKPGCKLQSGYFLFHNIFQKILDKHINCGYYHIKVSNC